MAELPRIAIVTPSYNQAEFLARTLDSVLNQGYPNLDYYVCDGGSTDGSVDILRSYGSRLRWRSERDGGQSDAINFGLRHTQGDIVAYLNSDDVLWPGALARVAAAFTVHPEVELIYGDAYHLDAADRILGPYPTAPYSFERMLHECCICQPAAFWRRGVIERIGGFDARLHFAMDYEYWLRLGRAGGRLLYLPGVLAGSRLHEAAKTQARRLEVHREILQVSVRHAGQASFHQCLAYWTYRCHERPGDWAGALAPLLGGGWWPAVAHAHWLRAQGRAGLFARRLAAALGRRFIALASTPAQALARRSRQAAAGLRPTVRPATGPALFPPPEAPPAAPASG